jgi:hypothetical protein
MELPCGCPLVVSDAYRAEIKWGIFHRLTISSGDSKFERFAGVTDCLRSPLQEHHRHAFDDGVAPSCSAAQEGTILAEGALIDWAYQIGEVPRIEPSDWA